MLGLITAALLLANEPGSPAASVRIALEADPRLACDLTPALMIAVRARAPQLRMAMTGEREDFAVAVAHEEGRWQLRVRRGDGELALSRELFLDRPSCAELADSCAIVLERFFRTIEWTPPARRIQSGEVSHIERTTGIPSAQQPRQDSDAVTTRLALSAGGAWVWESTGAASFGISLEAALALEEKTRLSLELMLGRATQIPVVVADEVRGALNVQRTLLLGKAARCARWGALQPCGGLAAGASIASGSASGRLYQQRSRVSALPAAGLFARISCPLPLRFEVSADALAAIPMGSGSFTVEGTDARYSTPAVESTLGLHLGWFFF